MTSSVGIWDYDIGKNKIHVPNHQPDIVLICINSYWMYTLVIKRGNWKSLTNINGCLNVKIIELNFRILHCHVWIQHGCGLDNHE